jgi:hypothetical protein
LETATRQLEPSQESTADDPWQRCLSLLKTAMLEVKNVPACCGEESMSSCSATLFTPHSINKPFQHLHIECLINSGPFVINSKWMIPLMSKKQIDVVFISDFDIHGFFGLGIHHKWILTSLMFHLAISGV